MKWVAYVVLDLALVCSSQLTTLLWIEIFIFLLFTFLLLPFLRKFEFEKVFFVISLLCKKCNAGRKCWVGGPSQDLLWSLVTTIPQYA